MRESIQAMRAGDIFPRIRNLFAHNLSWHCKNVTEKCLHCLTHFFKTKNNPALGESNLVPNYSWVFDVMYMSKSNNYNYLLVGAWELTHYVVFYPL